MNVAHLNPKALLLREWLRDYESLQYAKAQYANLTDCDPAWRHSKCLSELKTAQWNVDHFGSAIPVDLIASIKAFIA